jgi:hypothetical protein
MKTLLLAIPFLLVVGLVVYAQGSFSGFTVWNCLPVAAGFGMLVAGLHTRGAIAVACVTFAVSATSLVTLFHLAWLFDWGGTATGSSTSALAFIFVPIWVCLRGHFCRRRLGHQSLRLPQPFSRAAEHVTHKMKARTMYITLTIAFMLIGCATPIDVHPASTAQL